MANPFYIEPANSFSPLQALMQRYDTGQKIQTEANRKSALAELMNNGQGGGMPDYAAVANRLAQAGDLTGAAHVATVAKTLAGPEQTDLIKNLAAENKARVAKGLAPLSPLDYDLQKEKAKATIVHTNTTVNNAVSPILKGIGDRFNESVESAKAAGDQINSIYEARDALDKGAFTNLGADQKLWLSKAAGLFGLPQETAANTEVLRSALGQQMLANVKKLGANPSNADRVIIQEIVGAKGDLTEGTIRRVLDMQERWARESIKKSNATARGIMQANPTELGKYGGLLNTEEPPSYQDYIKARNAPKAATQPGRTQTGVQWRVVP